MKRLSAMILLLSAFHCLGAVEVGGVELPEKQDGLSLHGAGLLRKGFVFKIYVGALYLENSADAERVMEPVPKRLDVHYFHRTPKKYMIHAAEDALRRNLSPEAFERVFPNIGKLHDAYVDGQKGSCASLVYTPGQGLQYLVDGQLVASIKDDEFANDYFSVWLGEAPASRTMKKNLLRRIVL